MNVEHVHGCCGVREITQLRGHAGDAKEAMVAFKRQIRQDHRFRYVFFTEAYHPDGFDERGYGESFAAFIHEHKLGGVIETDFHTNPNSGSELKMWVWTVNHDALRKWNVRKRVAKKAVKHG